MAVNFLSHLLCFPRPKTVTFRRNVPADGLDSVQNLAQRRQDNLDERSLVRDESDRSNLHKPTMRHPVAEASNKSDNAILEVPSFAQRIACLEEEVVALRLALQVQTEAESRRIEHYEPMNLLGFDSQSDRLHQVLRSFYRAGKPYFWAVDVQSLQTQILPHERLVKKIRKSRADELSSLRAAEFEQSPYFKLVEATTRPGQPLENAGLTRCNATPEGCLLTVDLCTSSKPFEHAFFDALRKRSYEDQKPLPVALCVSGLWAQKNTELLHDISEDKNLDVTWVNHSFGHAYYPDKSYSQNFLLYPGTHLMSEVFETERMLLSRNICPSIFFRLPGLVANDEVLKTFHQLGLVPLGADAWLAKNQQAKAGSIVLVHGNGNEPLGIAAAMPLVQGAQQLRFCSLEKEAQKHSLNL